MEKKKGFFALGVFVLLAVLLVPSAKSFAGKVTIEKTGYEIYQISADNGNEDSDEWMHRDNDENKNEYEEEYKEEAEEMDEQYESAPSDLEDESSTELPSDEEDVPSTD